MIWKTDFYYPPTPAPSPEAIARAQVKHCSQCGTKVDAGFKFCPSCGQSIEAPVQDPNKVCKCGRVFAVKDRFCDCCGAQRPAARSR